MSRSASNEELFDEISDDESDEDKVVLGQMLWYNGKKRRINRNLNQIRKEM
ncbi:MAG: hypothetical protein ACLSG8_01205 [Barnesiella sp.]